MSGTGRGRPARRSKLTAVRRGRSLFFLIIWSPLNWLSISPTWNSSPSAGYQWVYAIKDYPSVCSCIFCALMTCISLNQKTIWYFLPTGNALQFPRSTSLASLCSLLQFVDYQNYIRNCCMKDIPVMERSIALCNGISQWVQLMVLSRPTAQLRAEVFTKFIHVAQVVVQSTFQYHSVSDPGLVKKKNETGFFFFLHISSLLASICYCFQTVSN